MTFISKSIYDFYKGFYINQPVGNNAFSYSKRINKQIYVPPLIQGKLSDLAHGDKIVFSEIEDRIEKNNTGLKNFIHWITDNKNIFIFDNHNHAFFFWMWGWMQGKIEAGTILVHVDQHTDMRNPGVQFQGKLDPEIMLDRIFKYTNFELNVGNFLLPAINLGLFSSIEMVNNKSAFSNPIPDKYILDIDMDIFAPEFDFMYNKTKLVKIKLYIKKASFITIATSPFFIDQNIAIKYLNNLFD